MNPARVTLVIPVLNEAENVGPLAAECLALREELPNLVTLFVNDGSSDETGPALDALAAASNGALHVHHHPERLGQSAALCSGFALGRELGTDIFVTMDGDRQNNPADIPALVNAIGDSTTTSTKSVDVVCGYRAERKDTWSRRAASKLGNTVRNWVTRDGLRDTGCSLKAFRVDCAADLPPLDGMHRFMGAYFAMHGRSVSQVPVDHRPRVAGTSKYTNLSRLPRIIYDLWGFCWYRRRSVAPALERTRRG